MRGRIIASVAGFCCLGAVGIAQAQDDESTYGAGLYDRGLYAGVGLQLLRADIRGSDNGTSFSVDSLPLELLGRVGYQILPWVAVEAFGAFGIHDDPNDGRIGAGRVRNGETELKYHAGIGIKPKYAFVFAETSQLAVFAQGGYSFYELEGDAFDSSNGNVGVSFSRDDDAPYYGVGLAIESEVATFELQYVDYDRGDGLDLEGYTISVNRYF